MSKTAEMLIRTEQLGVEGLQVVYKIIHPKKNKYQKVKLQVLHMQE